MDLKKPRSVEKSPFRSAKWDEITKDRDFRESDIPTLSLLCYWYQIAEKSMEDITIDDDIEVAYGNNMGDVKELPQIGTMKKASDAIRALNKQLGIKDEVQSEQPKKKETVLSVIQTNRFTRAKNSRTSSA